MSSLVDEAPVKHLHLKELSSIPSLLRGADAFTITRMESSNGLAERITKVSSVPALLVAVSIKSYSSQGPGRHRGRSRRWSCGDLQGVGCGGRSRSEPTDQEHSSLHRAARLAVPLGTRPPQSDPGRSFAPKVRSIAGNRRPSRSAAWGRGRNAVRRSC